MGNPISRRENLVVQEMDGEVLIYDLRVNKAFVLMKLQPWFGKPVMVRGRFRR